MYNSYQNRNQAPDQTSYGALQQVLRADRQQQAQMSQPASTGFGYGQTQNFSGQALQQVMQADRQAQMQQQTQYGQASYGQAYGQQSQYGHFGGYASQASPGSMNQVMQADHTGQFGPSYTNYNAQYGASQQTYANPQARQYGQYTQANRQTAQNSYSPQGLQHVMQADHMAAQMNQAQQPQTAYGSAYAYSGSQQAQFQPQVQQGQYQQAQFQQGQQMQQQYNPGALSQVIRADQQGYAGPSRTNYNF